MKLYAECFDFETETEDTYLIEDIENIHIVTIQLLNGKTANVLTYDGMAVKGISIDNKAHFTPEEFIERFYRED